MIVAKILLKGVLDFGEAEGETDDLYQPVSDKDKNEPDDSVGEALFTHLHFFRIPGTGHQVKAGDDDHK